MAVVGKLSVQLTTQTAAFTRGLGRSEKQVEGFAKRSRGHLSRLGKAVGLVGISAGFKSAVASGEKFNQAMASSTAIMGDLSDQMLREMEATARIVAQQTKFSATEAAEAYFFLASAGLDAKQSVAAMPSVARFAQAGMFDLATATDLVTDAQSALGLSVKNSQQNLRNLRRVSDVLVKANTLANASVQQFSEALTNKAGAALRQVGKSLEEGVAILTVFADQGVKGAEAGTQLAIVLRDLQTKAIANEAGFAKMGIGVFDAAGEMRHMADIMADLEAALDGMSDKAKKSTLLDLGFSDKSVGAISTLLGGSDKIRKNFGALNSAKKLTDEIASKQLPKLTKSWTKTKAAVSELNSTLTDTLGPALEAIMGLFRGLVSLVNQFVGLFKKAGELIEKYVGPLRTIGHTFGEIKKGLAGRGKLSDLMPVKEAKEFEQTFNRISKADLIKPEKVKQAVQGIKRIEMGAIELKGALKEIQDEFVDQIKDLTFDVKFFDVPDEFRAVIEAKGKGLDDNKVLQLAELILKRAQLEQQQNKKIAESFIDPRTAAATRGSGASFALMERAIRKQNSTDQQIANNTKNTVEQLQILVEDLRKVVADPDREIDFKR